MRREHNDGHSMRVAVGPGRLALPAKPDWMPDDTHEHIELVASNMQRTIHDVFEHTSRDAAFEQHGAASMSDDQINHRDDDTRTFARPAPSCHSLLAFSLRYAVSRLSSRLSASRCFPKRSSETSSSSKTPLEPIALPTNHAAITLLTAYKAGDQVRLLSVDFYEKCCIAIDTSGLDAEQQRVFEAYLWRRADVVMRDAFHEFNAKFVGSATLLAP